MYVKNASIFYILIQMKTGNLNGTKKWNQLMALLLCIKIYFYLIANI